MVDRPHNCALLSMVFETVGGMVNSNVVDSELFPCGLAHRPC